MRSRVRPLSVLAVAVVVWAGVSTKSLVAQTEVDAVKSAKILTVAGTGQAKLGPLSGVATKVAVAQPFGVEIGPRGHLYITEVGNHRVLRVDRKTGQLTTVAGTGQQGYSGDGGVATKAKLNEPYEVRFDRQGNMYFVEMQNHIVRMVEAKSGKIRTIAGTGTAGFGGDGGPATKAQLKRPHSIALDHRGGLYIADIGNHRIRRVDLGTGKIESIAGSTKKRLPRDGQLARGNPVLGPRALYIHENTLWVALREGHSVWRIDLAAGRWRHVAGVGKKGYQGDGGNPLLATFNGPKGICVDDQQRVFVVDTENHAIRRIDLRTNKIMTVAGNGSRGPEGDGGPAIRGQLDRPHGICVDAAGAIYIGDTVNHRVRKVTAK